MLGLTNEILILLIDYVFIENVMFFQDRPHDLKTLCAKCISISKIVRQSLLTIQNKDF